MLASIRPGDVTLFRTWAVRIFLDLPPAARAKSETTPGELSQRSRHQPQRHVAQNLLNVDKCPFYIRANLKLMAVECSRLPPRLSNGPFMAANCEQKKTDWCKSVDMQLWNFPEEGKNDVRTFLTKPGIQTTVKHDLNLVENVMITCGLDTGAKPHVWKMAEAPGYHGRT